jgi:hypothetical protein
MAPQTLVRAEAMHALYPDLTLDPRRGTCGSFERGLLAFEGFVGNANEPADDPWYGREVRRGGMELLYRARTRAPGVETDNAVVAWRTMPTSEGGETTTRGRVVTFAFHPYYFQEQSLRTSMRYALRWLITGAE